MPDDLDAEKKRQRRRRRFKIVLVCGSLVLGIGLAEGIGSIGLKRLPRKPSMPPEAAATVRSGDRSVATTPDPYLMYRVEPNLRHDHCHTNSLGLRNDEVPEQPAPGTFRILVLGGSVAWGYSARNNSETLAAFIERGLEEKKAAYPGLREKRIEVLNAGVFAYVSWQGVMSYCRHLRQLRPNAVITLDGANEVHAAIRNGRPGWPMRYTPSKKTYGDQPDLMASLGEWASYRAGRLKIVRYLRKLRPATLADWQPPPADEVAVEFGRALELLEDVTSADDALLMAVLQPTALLPSSKPLAQYETDFVDYFDGRIPGQNAYYTACYDRFRALFSRLATERPAAGWVDATRVFKDERGLAYSDQCHLTLRGRRRLGAFLVDRFLEVVSLEAAQPLARNRLVKPQGD